MSRRPPEIFIVGTMKGGTTVLHDYICCHPRVVPGCAKEIHYFTLHAQKGLGWYADQFPDRPDDIFSIDASPTYFDVANTDFIPNQIRRSIAAPRIILIVRDPIERTISHYEHLRQVSEKDMFKAIEIDEFLSRPLDRFDKPRDPSDIHFKYAIQFSVYDVKFQNYVNVFGRDNILVLTNDQLRAEPEQTMRRVFEFCGLAWVPSPMFGRAGYSNGSKNTKISGEVRSRLAAILYPSYERFCALAALTSDVG